MNLTIHLLPNAHLDPVWLWDWREGLTEGIQTCRTILDLMDEDPTVTFIRGEAMIYQHIERYAPQTFRRIMERFEEGRWDVVGGTLIQSDNNLPCTEALVRQFKVGQSYFKKAFGKHVRVAWSADAFGHSAGLPEIFSEAGIESFAFSRPAQEQMPLSGPAFWWEGEGGARILAYRPTSAYLSERSGVSSTLNQLVEEAERNNLPVTGLCYGVGNHGGGPTRALQAEILRWSESHMEVKIVPSGLHRFFEDMRSKISQREVLLPTRRGELGFCLRGCYSSAARFKFAYRLTESRLLRAERTSVAIGAATNASGVPLDSAWQELLFSAFHDILPGSSIERAMNEQMAWLGSVDLACQKAELDALTILADSIDTTVRPVSGDVPAAVPVLVWNPHLNVFKGHVEIEACLDYRPIFSYAGKAAAVPLRVLDAGGYSLPYQEVSTEHTFMPEYPWRKRLVVPVEVPAMGWTLLEYGWVEGAERPPANSCLTANDEAGEIKNEAYRITARVGDLGLRIWHHGREVFDEPGLGAAIFEDAWGSWGGLQDQAESLHIDTVKNVLKITQIRILERGPERVSLWVQLAGGGSSVDLTCSLSKGREAANFDARVFFNERRARLKLRLPVGNKAIFEVPGGTVEREPSGEVPGGRWVRLLDNGRVLGFASNALYNFDLKEGMFGATVVRSAGYATDGESPDWSEPWRPVSDAGEYRFQFLLQSGDERLPQMARELEQPLIVQLVTASQGTRPREGSLLQLQTPGVEVLAISPSNAPGEVDIRLQSLLTQNVTLTWLGQQIDLGILPGGKIQTWTLSKAGRGFLLQPPAIWPA